jgi:hypothetical protein
MSQLQPLNLADFLKAFVRTILSRPVAEPFRQLGAQDSAGPDFRFLKYLHRVHRFFWNRRFSAPVYASLTTSALSNPF